MKAGVQKFSFVSDKGLNFLVNYLYGTGDPVILKLLHLRLNWIYWFYCAPILWNILGRCTVNVNIEIDKSKHVNMCIYANYIKSKFEYKYKLKTHRIKYILIKIFIKKESL